MVVAEIGCDPPEISPTCDYSELKAPHVHSHQHNSLTHTDFPADGGLYLYKPRVLTPPLSDNCTAMDVRKGGFGFRLLGLRFSPTC